MDVLVLGLTAGPLFCAISQVEIVFFEFQVVQLVEKRLEFEYYR